VTVADHVVQAFEDAGVGLACGLDDPPALFASLRRSAIRTVIVHDERGGAFMVDGYGRASGRLGLCAGVSGPGATNLITGLLEAFQSSTAALAVVGEVSNPKFGRAAFQEAPHEQLLAPVTKQVVRVRRQQDARPAALHAAALATSGRRRPAALLVDADLLWEDGAAQDGKRAAHLVLGTVGRPLSANGGDLADAAAALVSAKQPVVLAGNGVHLSGGGDVLQQVAEKYRLPIATSLYGKGSVAETLPYAIGVASAYTSGAGGCGRVARQALTEADVVLVVGSDLDPVTTNGGEWPAANATVIRIDIDEAELLTHEGIRLCGDARSVLEQLLVIDVITSRDERYLEWLDNLCDTASAWREELHAQDLQHQDQDTVWPGAVVQEIAARLLEGDALVTDASYSSAWALDRVCQAWPGRHVFAPRGTGVLGWGLPAALGVKLARPDQRVVCLSGDGGLLFSIGELETAVRENIPITLVVLNNESYGFQRHSAIRRQGEDYADLQINGVAWADVARAFGWRGQRVTSLADFAAAFRESLDGGFSLLEVAVDKEARPPIASFDAPREVAGVH
jgi:acetolactate synthase-1/2/3 large subunit